MENLKISKGLIWILFIISTVICVWMVIVYPQWFWVMLPFVLTLGVKAFDAM